MITAHYNRDNPDGGLYRAYSGVEYCGDNGADIINLSWGSYGPPSITDSSVIAYAQQQGAIIFAAAGNDNHEDHENDNQRIYPATYENVIAVACSDDRDHKSNDSNYGDFIDLVAPGIDILSACPRNSYESHDNTSQACPVAAGIGALMLSVESDLTAGQLLSWMQRTSVDISTVGENDQYPGIVHRVDAGFLLNSTHPMYEISEWEVIEINGDQDGRIERNETISINLTLANLEGYADAGNVTINLQNDDEWIHISTGEINIGDIANGDSHELTENQYPTFHVNGRSPIHYSTFILNVTSDEGCETSFELQMTIRQPLFLLMDDDDGEAFETYYHEDMMQRPIVHDTWDVSTGGLPSPDEFNSYSFVVWETGNDETPLSQEEQSLISGFLDNGGYLLLSGQFIGDDIGDTEFHRNYLKSRHLNDDTESLLLAGNENNPLTGGIDLLITGEGGAGNGSISPSSMEPLDGAVSIFNYTTNEQEPGGIYYAGDYHLVYFGFAMEAVSGRGGTASRVELLERILDHFYETRVEDGLNVVYPTSFKLGLPHPNPFNSRTLVSVDVPYGVEYVLEVIDLSGRQIDVLHSGSAIPGLHKYSWNAENIPAGVYLFNLKWDEGSISRKIVLVR